ncbi:hypothetical protein KCU87_g198, partial [Aureobasidium melanogenum]
LHAIYPPSAKHEGNTTSSSLLNRILLNRVLVPMCQKRRYKHMDQFCVYKLEERILVDCPERTRLSGRRVSLRRRRNW